VIKLTINKLFLILIIGILFSACTSSVPLPSQESIINSFFNLINEKRIPEAINMMDPKAVSDESTKQALGVQFNDFDSVKVISIEKFINADDSLYQVELAAKINPRAANYPIPYYGYSDQSDIRFIKLVKNSQGIWKIESINTGP